MGFLEVLALAPAFQSPPSQKRVHAALSDGRGRAARSSPTFDVDVWPGEMMFGCRSAGSRRAHGERADRVHHPKVVAEPVAVLGLSLFHPLSTIIPHEIRRVFDVLEGGRGGERDGMWW